MRQRGYLMGSVWFKLWRAAALRSIGPEHVAKLRYDDGGKDLLGTPPGAEGKRWIATLGDLAPAIEALAALAGPEATDGGSNNWAVAPSRTAAGRPLLAGDPHRAFEMPSLYFIWPAMRSTPSAFPCPACLRSRTSPITGMSHFA
jgi:penicillin amidase